MKNLKLENIRRTVFFVAIAASSAATQLLAQNLYPVFEDKASELYIERVANFQAID